MTLAVAQAISGFPVGEPQSPALVTVPASILDQIFSEIQALRAEVQDLKATVTRQDGELSTLRQQITALEATQETQAENQLIQLRLIKDLREDVQKPTEPTEKTTDHIDQLARIMTEDRRHAVSVAVAARLLGISKERMRQLKPLLLADGRFELGWDRQRGQKKRVVIRLKQFIK